MNVYDFIAPADPLEVRRTGPQTTPAAAKVGPARPYE